MKTISLTNSEDVVLVSDEDFSRVEGFTWFLKSSQSGLQYVVRSCRDGSKIRTIRMHRFITGCPEEYTVDHVNKNRLDNTRPNLELVSKAENSRRMHQSKREHIPI